MSIISLNNDVCGYLIKKKIICRHCIKEKEFLAITEDMVLLIKKVDSGDLMYFCDRCGKRI